MYNMQPIYARYNDVLKNVTTFQQHVLDNYHATGLITVGFPAVQFEAVQPFHGMKFEYVIYVMPKTDPEDAFVSYINLFVGLMEASHARVKGELPCKYVYPRFEKSKDISWRKHMKDVFDTAMKYVMENND